MYGKSTCDLCYLDGQCHLSTLFLQAFYVFYTCFLVAISCLLVGLTIPPCNSSPINIGVKSQKTTCLDLTNTMGIIAFFILATFHIQNTL